MGSAIVCAGVSKHFRVPLDRSTTLKYRLSHLRATSRYHDFRALEDVSFDVPEGQFLGIVGHNGSGKSTLLKVLSRIYVPDSGTVRLTGNVSPFLELGVGFNPELTARENIYLNGAVLGLTHAELDRRIDGIVEFAELADFVDQKLKNYSSGMQVRLAFSVAIQADAQILLMDEVLAVGDQRFQEKCFDTFGRYKRDGRTVILVTHDLSAVNLYCDRALMLDHGRLVADGTPRDVTGRYKRHMGQASETEDARHPTGETTERWGTRDVEVGEVRLLTEDGDTHRVFSAGEPMVVEVDWAVNSDRVRDFLVALRFDRTDGLSPLAYPSTLLTQAMPGAAHQGMRGTLRYHVGAWPFLSGSYLMTVEVHDEHRQTVYDQVERAVGFRIIDEKTRLGLVELGGRWEGRPTA